MSITNSTTSRTSSTACEVGSTRSLARRKSLAQRNWRGESRRRSERGPRSQSPKGAPEAPRAFHPAHRGGRRTTPGASRPPSGRPTGKPMGNHRCWAARHAVCHANRQREQIASLMDHAVQVLAENSSPDGTHSGGGASSAETAQLESPEPSTPQSAEENQQ